MTDDLAGLAAVPVFAGLDPDRLRRLAAGTAVRTVPAGAVVAVRGEPADHLVVVEAGALTAVHDTADGRRVRIAEFPAPCAVDKTAVLDGGGHTATWIAATRVRLRLLPAGRLSQLIDDVPATRRHVLRHLSQQVRGRQEALVDAYLGDAATRTAGWLVRAASRTGRTRLVLPGAQQGLAEAVGASRVSVNRALRAFADAGLIRVEPGAVEILAPELLARRAGG